MNKILIFQFFALIGVSSFGQSLPQDRPNILCLVIEDRSPYQFGCYGSKDIKTPTIDGLAEKGILYTNASSNAPHCSPARSTLITGCYATTFGMDVHRETYITPQNIFFPQLLRDAGYFCTNNSKTDYNTTVNNDKLWDESSSKATYMSKDRKSNQPFFAVFNTEATHMGLVRTITTEDRPDFKKFGIDENNIFLPKHVPDLPEVRSDEAYQLKASQEADSWVKAHLEKLKSEGLTENTIVLFYSDHGGCLPRGKGFPFESGLRIPLVIYVPSKWQKELNVKEGLVVTKNVSFVDFAPTFLSLAGVKTPKFMQGKAFLGTFEKTPEKLQYGFRTNQENYHYDPSRTVSDGHFKYIRNYIPYKPFCLRNLYQWGMPANLAWDEYVMSGECKNPDWLLPYKPKSNEMLFDLEKDPWELNNLSNNPEYKSKLSYFRKQVSKHIRASKDLGFCPREMRKTKKNGLFNWVEETHFPLGDLYNAAELASSATLEDLPELLKLLKSPHDELRYWGVVGFCTLGSQKMLKEVPDDLRKMLNDKEPEVVSMAAEAFCYLGEFDLGVNKLVSLLKENYDPAYSSLETLTWYPKQKEMLIKYISTFQKIAAEHANEGNDRMELGVKVRSILVNLGALPLSELYSKKDIEEGIKKNKAGRKFLYPSDIFTN